MKSDMINNKESFLKYLQTCVKSTRNTSNNPLYLANNAPKDYVRFLESEKLFDYNPKKWVDINMYEIDDPKKAEEIYYTLYKDPDFEKRNNDNNQGWRLGALAYYVCFLNAKSLFLQNGQLTKKTISLVTKDKNDEYAKLSFNLESIISFIKETNLLYDDKLIQRYAYSLLTKPFVILSGLAGSGKTQLALAFAKAMVEDEEKQMCVVSVGADWTNREPLLGYPNALKDNSYVKPENGVLDLLIESNKPENSSKPYFLILDEMNLSYVERYFADFLFAMESHVNIPLWKGEGYDVPQSVSLPKNLFITGTINVDETTYMFSPKVLDRANVIEFKVSEKDMESFLINAPVVDMSNLNGSASNMAADYVRIASESIEISKEANNVLKEFFKQLKTVNAEFGYRTATEIGRFISLSKDTLDVNDAIDVALVQKLLPKLHGSRKKIVPVLKELWKLCGAPNSLEEHNLLDDLPIEINYKLTADKVLRMYRCAIENGFTSFAEA